ncbi:hypothetical protein F0562_033438 [Nyssa sinensis]|uniref:Uncharacterized protein n=1 Tax=Nyssa sinensis TaxID=561372 RepID=A0A5J5AFN5_9ASTE|nr:hypothetical protein F0562_033438 [Nyssa sinensis]
MVTVDRILLVNFICIALLGVIITTWAEDMLISPTQLEMFVDDLPDPPKIQGFNVVNGVFISKALKIGMFHKKWKFHRDLPPTPVFAYWYVQVHRNRPWSNDRGPPWGRHIREVAKSPPFKAHTAVGPDHSNCRTSHQEWRSYGSASSW